MNTAIIVVLVLIAIGQILLLVAGTHAMSALHFFSTSLVKDCEEYRGLFTKEREARKRAELFAETRITDKAFAITAKGIVALPEDWKGKCFPPPPISTPAPEAK